MNTLKKAIMLALYATLTTTPAAAEEGEPAVLASRVRCIITLVVGNSTTHMITTHPPYSCCRLAEKMRDEQKTFDSVSCSTRKKSEARSIFDAEWTFRNRR